MMKINNLLALVVCLIIIILTSCNNENDKQLLNEFDNYISNLTQHNVEFKTVDIDSEITGLHKVILDNADRLLVVDHTSWNIHLLDENGEIKYSIGELGTGPAEYLQINQVFINDDNQLFILDKKLQRIVVYQILENNIEPLRTINLPSFGSLSIQKYYQYEDNSFGIFKELGSHDNSQYFYSLNNELEIQDLLLEFDGNEVESVRVNNSFTAFYEVPFGSKTYFDFYQGQLIHSKNNKIAFKKFSLVNNTISEINENDIPERKKTDETADFLSSKFNILINRYPELQNNLEFRDLLPIFHNFKVNSEFIYVKILGYESDSQEYILRYNSQTNEFKKIQTPNSFYLHAVTDSRLYGILRGNDREDDKIVYAKFR